MKQQSTPPRLPLRFLEWYCPSRLYEGIEGDLVEQFEEDIKSLGLKKARRRFTWNVFKFFRPEIILRNKFKNHFFQLYMLQNYLKIAFRSLWRSKAHSLINVFGLGLGIVCCILITLFVNDELTFDKFHKKADRIYRVYARENYGENQEFFYTVTPFPMGPALKENFPEVESQVRINKIGTQVKVGENFFNETVTIGGQDLFNVFDFKIIKGESANSLNNQSHVVISDVLAKKYFGETDPINKTISIQLGEAFEDFTVAAVAKIPTNSSIQFYLLISDLNYPKLYSPRLLTSVWFDITPETYVLLRENVDPKTVTNKFPSLFKTLLGEEDFKKSHYEAGLQPLTSIHLDTSYPVGIAAVNNPKYAYILAAIALLILFVACINFVTLSIGRSLKRAKEVGIRKVVGAARTQLIVQFVGEAIIVTLISMTIGLILAAIGLPLFNNLAGKQLVLPFNLFMVEVVGVLLLIIGLIAGSYPAFMLSGFQPISILKGSIQLGSSKQGLRKVLVGVQLMFSIFLISSTLIMRDQLSFLQNKNLGFSKEQLAVIPLNVPRGGRMAERVGKGFEIAEQFKLELVRFPQVASICASSHDFANGNWVNVGFTDDNGTYRNFNLNSIDDDYLTTLKMDLVSGRNFSDDNPADKRRSIIVNESFAKEYGWTDANGKKIPGKNFGDHEIIGVVKDFHYASLYTKVAPLVLVEDPSIILKGTENISVDNSPMPKLLVRLKPGNAATTIEQIKTVWDKITGGEEFNFTFVDQALAEQYRSDQNLGKIVSIATVLAAIIASLGLYGLASLALQSRTKEVSIRKVMGATENSLLLLLTKEYVVLIAICVLISVPATWYLMASWLSSFEYRIEIGVQVFVLAGGISLVIALATISFQTLKTVWTNPVKSLNYE
jgi:putative ABC transport system permease protein